MAAERPLIKIDVISDTVCPWCYVGKRRLEKAMDHYTGVADFEISWLPFQLDPTSPKEGINKLQFYRQKFGPKVDVIIPAMTQTYKELGMTYSIGGLTGNTLDSHRLSYWAKKEGGPKVQGDLMEKLFQSYFCQEKFIGDHAMLAGAAAEVGLDHEAAAAVLKDPNAFLDEVKQEISKGRGVGGVPFFTINNKYKLSGAQPSASFAEVFDTILGKKNPTMPFDAIFGKSC